MAPFEVGIIGGGIGGLSTAIALRRAGVNVEIFEKSTYSNESGNAIYITPNAGRILDKWGLNTPPKAPGSSTLSAEVYSTARPVEVTRVVVLPAKTLDPPTVVDLTNAQADYDTTVKLYDREDLHSALRVLATAPTPSFSRMTHIHNAGDVVLRLGALVVDVDSVAGTLKLKDGDTIKKDLIIVADGIQSRFMEYINHHPNLLRDMGLTGYHFSVPMSALLEDPDLAPLTGALLDQNATPSSSGLPQAPYVALVDNDAELLVVVSAIKGGEAVRIFTHRGPGNDDDYKDTAVIYDNGHEPKGKISERGEQKEQEDTDGDLHAWNNRRASKNDVLRNVEQFHPVLSKLVQKATDIRSFTMRIRDPVKHLHNGLATMLGDSAGATWALQGNTSLSRKFSSLHHILSLQACPSSTHHRPPAMLASQTD
ncbi:hypothetical protein F4810DRAFT_661692 [Camillea tinctor]|nr:hypothetical protein F4810DRAFT_661692 [Camillea tinctor]